MRLAERHGVILDGGAGRNKSGKRGPASATARLLQAIVAAVDDDTVTRECTWAKEAMRLVPVQVGNEAVMTWGRAPRRGGSASPAWKPGAGAAAHVADACVPATR